MTQPKTGNYSPNVAYDLMAAFSASNLSNAIDLSGCKIVGFVTPASLGTTALSVQAATTENGTYIDVVDETGAVITATVSTSAANWCDLTNIFPASIRFIKLKAGTSITADVILANTAI